MGERTVIMFKSIAEIPHICTYCDLRHKMCDYNEEDYLDKSCPHFILGGCFTCQHGGLDGANDYKIVEDNTCVSVMIFDYEKCRNYKKDKKLWKEWKKVRREKKL